MNLPLTSLYLSFSEKWELKSRGRMLRIFANKNLKSGFKSRYCLFFMEVASWHYQLAANLKPLPRIDDTLQSLWVKLCRRKLLAAVNISFIYKSLAGNFNVVILFNYWFCQIINSLQKISKVRSVEMPNEQLVTNE